MCLPRLQKSIIVSLLNAQNSLNVFLVFVCRTHCHPVLDASLPSLSSRLSSFYAKLRKRAAASGGLPLTLRFVHVC